MYPMKHLTGILLYIVFGVSSLQNAFVVIFGRQAGRLACNARCIISCPASLTFEPTLNEHAIRYHE